MTPTLRTVALGLAALTLAVAPLAARAGPALPSGGQVQAGAATIGAASGGSLAITQTSPKAVIDWSSFSIGAGGAVSFNNGAGVTLNRVTGGSLSQIDGLLSASGGVYVLNPQGVIVGKNGVVNTGGTFVASTLALSNDKFLAGGSMTFAGASTAAVTNNGIIRSAGGDVALLGATVTNNGEIDAPNGDVALGGGLTINLLDHAGDDGMLSVTVGGPGTSVTNTGLIQAADAELRANGGDVYALAVGTGSHIQVQGVSENDGHVWLIADGGAATAQGEIDASRAGGAGGEVETSGESVNFSGLSVYAGDWLVDPVSLQVDQTAANTIATNLATTNVTLQTTATGASGPGNQFSGAGDIDVDAPISWSSANTLSLSAYGSVLVAAPITVAGPGKLVIATGQGGTIGNLTFGFSDSISISGATSFSETTGSIQFVGAPNSGQALTINGQPYTLIYSEADLLGVNNDLAGHYAVADNFELGGFFFTQSPIAPNVSAPFTGVFEGLGNQISGLTIDQFIPTTQQLNGYTGFGTVGLIGMVGAGGVMRDLTLNNALIQGGDGMTTGIAAGIDQGELLNVHTSGEVDGGDTLSAGSNTFNFASVGGLVAQVNEGGMVVNSSSSADASGGAAFVGGLVGVAGAGAVITNSFATGTATVGDEPAAGQDAFAGGLAGLVFGYQIDGTLDAASLSNDYATGAVFGGRNAIVGGFAGVIQGAMVTASYATGPANLASAGVADNTLFVNTAGGFAGAIDQQTTVTMSYASGQVSLATSSAVVGNAGGFVGVLQGPGGLASNDYAVGGVAIVGGHGGEAGGFAGVIQNGASADHVYASGVISDAGGLAGGVVSVLGTAPGGPNQPPNPAGTLTDAYWDEGTTGIGLGYTLFGAGSAINVAGIGGGTAINPYAAASYANLDLTNTWFIIDGETRPILRAEFTPNPVNAHQLQLMDLNLSFGYFLSSNIDASGTTNAAEVWNTANGFVPVGNLTTPFAGTINGRDFTIGNLHSTVQSGAAISFGASQLSEGQAGLIGFQQSGNILALNLSGAVITGGDGVAVGGLVGIEDGELIADSVTGSLITGGSSVMVGPSAADAAVGGLAGILVGSGGVTGTVINASTSGAVIGVDASVGGLVGSAQGATISSSTSSATVTDGDSAVQGPFAGGLVGEASGGAQTMLIENSWASGDVTTGVGGAAGGLVGLTDVAQISGSFATGNVVGGTNSATAGLVGALIASQINSSYATGSVSAPTVGTAGSINDVGGLVANEISSSTISGSWASGSVSAAAGSSNQVAVGGLVAVVGSSSQVSDSYALGAVSVSGSSPQALAGGLVGDLQGGSIGNDYATGAVTGTVAGGLIGQMESGTAGSNSYWDEGTTGLTGAIGSNLSGGTPNFVAVGGSSGLSAYQSSSYANFDSNWFYFNGETRPIQTDEFSTTITNSHQLELMSTNLSGSYTLGNSFSAADTAAGPSGLWNPANAFVPVGATAAAPFTGKLLGNDFTVSGLSIIDTASPGIQAGYGGLTNGAAGLFGFTRFATIEFLHLNGTVVGGDGMSVGLLAGQSESQVFDVTASGTVIGGNDVNDVSGLREASVGGLIGTVGQFSGTHTSSSTAAVTGGAANVGGLIGDADSGTGFANLSNDSASGLVTAGAYNGQIPNVGGLIGSSEGLTSIGTSYATGNVVAGGSSFVGGLIGSADRANLTLVYATGSVTVAAGAGGVQNQVGGLIGVMGPGVVQRASSSGAVNVTTVSGTPSQVGGFIGDDQGGSISEADSQSPVTTNGNGFNFLGGFAGVVDDNGTITQVYAAGPVSGAGDVAGLVGLLGSSGIPSAPNGILTNSYWDEGVTGQTTGFNLGVSGSTATGVVGMGGATGVDPFAQSTYAGWTFDNFDWAPPSAGFYPAMTGIAHVLVITAGSVTSQFGAFPVGTSSLSEPQITSTLQSSEFNFIEEPDVALLNQRNASSGFIDAGSYGIALSGAVVTDGNSVPYRIIYVNGQLTVTQKPLTASLTGQTSKVYDGTNGATLNSSDYSLTGVVAGDSVTLASPTSGTYANQNVGTGIGVSVNGFTLGGADAANYSVNAGTSAAAGTITPKQLTASLTGTVQKNFDGTTVATLAAGNYLLTGVVSGDHVALNDPAQGSYDTAAAGTGKAVTVTGLALSGAQASDYTVNATAIASIGVILAPTPPPPQQQQQPQTQPAGSCVEGSAGCGTPAPTVQTQIVSFSPEQSLTQDLADSSGSLDGGASNETDTGGGGAAGGSNASDSSSPTSAPVRSAVISVFGLSNTSSPNDLFGDNSPVTGAGNGDLWVGADQDLVDLPDPNLPPPPDEKKKKTP
ncbi:MAG TPA: YDG domain-containing protein [Caulobacteraceae bacterium]|jgi:filamentous hemagglutinin family protein